MKTPTRAEKKAEKYVLKKYGDSSQSGSIAAADFLAGYKAATSDAVAALKVEFKYERYKQPVTEFGKKHREYAERAIDAIRKGAGK